MSELAVVDNSDQHDLDQVAIDKEQLVTMVIEDQMFGVPILQVQDIVETRLITPVPLAPSAIAGVMNLRGRIVTVINLRRCLGVEAQDGDNRGMGITVEYMGDLYTLLVDSIGDVRDLPRRDYEKPPATLDEKLRRLSTGVYRLPDNLLVVLDIERVLDTDILMQTPTLPPKRRDTKNGQAAKEKTEAKAGRVDKASTETADAETTETSEPSETGNVVSFPAAAESETPAVSATESTSAEPATLFERIGGDEAVEAAVDIFYSKVLSDPALQPFFEGVDMDSQSFMSRLCFTGFFGGPQASSSQSLREAHQPIVDEKGLDDAEFAAMARHLQATLEDLGVTADNIQEVMARASIG